MPSAPSRLKDHGRQALLAELPVPEELTLQPTLDPYREGVFEGPKVTAIPFDSPIFLQLHPPGISQHTSPAAKSIPFNFREGGLAP